MHTQYDAIIVGAGVIGCSIAYNLSKRGRKVIVLERGKIAGKASSAAAGMLGAQTELEEDSPLFQFAKASRAMFPQLEKDLKGLSGIDIEFQQNGIYKVAMTEEEVSRIQRLIPAQQELGEMSEWIPAAELHVKEPALSKDTLGAMFIRNDGQVSSPALTMAFATAATTLGAEIHEYTDVHHLIEENERITGVKTNQGSFHADHVIVAGGAWSEQLLQEAGVELPTYPVKGECFSLKTKRRLVNGTIFSNEVYIVPKPGNQLIIGATEKPGTFDESVTVEGISSLMEKMQQVVPAIKEAAWERAWAGIRPQSADSLPYMGTHPDKEGLYIATGHYRNGILLAPKTGELIADLIDGKQVQDDWFSAFQTKRTSLHV
ncbi:glycine oxidase ThiO [Pseudalkalibacillus sp. SCS-8]|uniref:glycine oxidase ThiO n=1 Tax=Pseudalkalibacillus nanhaiensis TaxID=3115291 RepID=UPI0032DB0CAD